MGLRAVITGDDLGLPTEVSGQVLQGVDSDDSGENDTIENDNLITLVEQIDYSDAFAAFADAFVAYATEWVPVDTGYLRSTINAGSDSWGIECQAYADYAQYVQYGTWKMQAQPYFAPALSAAWGQTQSYFEQAIQQAQDRLEDAMAAYESQMPDWMGGGFGGFAGGLLGVALGAVVVGLIKGFFGLLSGHSHIPTMRPGTAKDIAGGNEFEQFIEIY